MDHRSFLGVVASVAAAAAAVALLASTASGHCHQEFPVSRQYAWSRDFHDHKFENLEGAPYAYNAGGVKAVQRRAKRETSSAALEGAGEGDKFPLYYLPLAENGNYMESNAIAKRHGVCGDPRLSVPETDNVYSTPNREWEVLDTFQSGQEIEINVAIVYYHGGHFEFSLCDIRDLDNPDGVVTQECLNKYPLTRAYNANDASPIDPNYPGRYYVDPPCRRDEVEQTVSDNFPNDPYNVLMRYTIPRITCPHCVLQMHWLTGNRCRHIGYDEFDPPSWNSKCAPDRSDWIWDAVGLCGESVSYPEEFWGCSDIAITSDGSSPTPTEDDSSPVAPDTPAPVSSDTPSPTSASYAATPSPTSVLDEEPVQRPTSSYPAPSTTTETSSETSASSTDPRPVCSNGVSGVESSLGLVCCVAECGQCGGPGCSSRGASLGLTRTDCCESDILEAGNTCGDAPCVIATDEDETGSSTSESDTTVTSATSGEEDDEADDETDAAIPSGNDCSAEDPVGMYEQCGGDLWEGSTCCDEGLTCVQMGTGTCYSQCRPIADAGSEETMTTTTSSSV